MYVEVLLTQAIFSCEFISCYIHRYGRITVSTLETKLASAEKDVTRLTKALERSDKYIEELETELEGYRGKTGTTRRDRDTYLSNGDLPSRKYASDSKIPSTKEYSKGADNPSRRQLFSDDMGYKSSSSGEGHKYYYDGSGDHNSDLHASKGHGAKSKVTNGGKKKVNFDLDKNTYSAMSFDLELPSPLKTSANASGLTNGRASPVKGVLKKKPGANDKSSDGYSTDLSKTLEDSLSESYDRYKTDRYSKDDNLVYSKSRSKVSDREEFGDRPRRKYSADDSMLSEPSDIELRRARETDYSRKSTTDYSSKRYDDLDDPYYSSSSRSHDVPDKLDRHDLDDTQCIESELDELNISLTPEFTDCMKILNRAEKNVHVRDPVLDDYTSRTSSSTDTNVDAAFRASTGSIGYKPRTFEDDYSSTTSYKTDTSKFTSSLDTYSRSRHVRSGSLDNLLNIDRMDEMDRPSSALPTTTNMYPPTNQSKYSSGLTTGRTSLTRTPSLDNLLMARPDPLTSKSRTAIPGYLGTRYSRGENDGKVDMAGSTGVGSVPVAASHGILGTGVSGTVDSHKVPVYNSALDGKSQLYTSDSKSIDLDRKYLSSGRLDSALPLSSTGMDYDKPSSGRVTPTIPTHSEYMSFAKVPTDQTSYPSNSGSGRSTPTLTTNTDYSTRTNPGAPYSDYRSSGPSSLPSDLSQKPPSGVRPLDPSRPYTSSYPSTNPSLNYNTNSGGGYSSLPPNYQPTGGAASGTYDSRSSSLSNHTDMKYGSSLGGRSTEYDSNINKHNDFGANSNYRSDSKYSASNNIPSYTDQHYKDGTDFSNFSTKVAVSSASSNTYLHPSSLPSANPMSSASSTGPLSYPGSSYLGSSSSGVVTGSYLGSSSSVTTGSSSYSTAHSVPLTHTTSSYTNSVPSNSYMPKPLDPIAETTGHYSYVSNMSGEYSSKNDTFALPEPKKRLFDNSDDLEMSMSPIKSNRRY